MLNDVIEDSNRLNALYNLQLLDTPAEESFDRLTMLVKAVLKVPTVFVALFDYDRIFFKSAVGLPEPIAKAREMPIPADFAPLLESDDPCEITIADPATNGAFRTILAIPLRVDQLVLGMLGAADFSERAWSADDKSILRQFAALVMTEVELRTELIARQRNQAQLQSYTRELEMVNAELDSYGDLIAHDLKDPLNIIMGFTALLEMEQELSPVAKSYIDQILMAGGVMTGMIEQLLHLAKLRDTAAEALPVDMEALLKNIHKRLEPRLKDAQIQFMIETPSLNVLGHAPWVEEVIANLVINAINYRDPYKPQKTITVRSLKLNGKVRYEVIDNGIGISKHDQERIFKRFARLNNAKNVKGTGLGLAIVHRIVNRLSGQVGVESVEGEGSTFWFTLPAA